jgi:ATP-binding cassette, subfamily B, bacterial
MNLLLLLFFCVFTSCTQSEKNNEETFPFYRQTRSQECGPTCLRMILKYYNKDVSQENLNKVTKLDSLNGTSLLDLSDAMEKQGFKTLAVKIGIEKLMMDAPLPCVVHWEGSHFVVVYKIENQKIYVADPSSSLLVYDTDTFLKGWIQKGSKEEGVALLIEQNP